MSVPTQVPRVSMFSRVCAWTLLLCSVATLAIVISDAFVAKRLILSSWQAVGRVAASVLLMSMSAHIALKGRPPRSFVAIDSFYARSLGYSDDTSAWAIRSYGLWLGLSSVTALALFLADRRGLFDDDSRGFAILLFILSLFAAVGTGWRIYRVRTRDTSG
jgi:hypothetical protein